MSGLWRDEIVDDFGRKRHFNESFSVHETWQGSLQKPSEVKVFEWERKTHEAEANVEVKSKKSICCACPNAKRLRAERIVDHG